MTPTPQRSERASFETTVLKNTEENTDELRRLASSIDFFSPKSIADFGADVAERTTHYTDEILNSARPDDLGETGRQLTEIVVAAQKFDLSSFDKPWTRIPIIGGLLKQVVVSKERAIARFESVKTQVDKLVSQVEATSDRLERRNDDYQAIYDGIKQEYQMLGVHVDAIRARLSDLELEISRHAASDDLEAFERLSILESARKSMSKRADDLTVLQHSAMQSLPMVRIIQSNNLAIVEKFKTVRQLTLPAWKRAFLLALALDEQKDAIALSDAIDDTTNAMMRRNAELLHQNSVATAKANQRLVIDVDTIKVVHEKILLTLADVQQAHEEGAQSRKTALLELQKLRLDMIGRTKAVANAG